MKNRSVKQIIVIGAVILSALQLQADSPVNESFLKNINTDGDETSCAVTGNGKFFIFARKVKNSSSSDLYYSEFKNTKWTDSKTATELNTDSDEISPYISADGKFILFSSNRLGSLKKSSSDKPSYDIYYSEKKGDGWEKPQLLFGAVNTSDDEINPFITNDGSILYFTRFQSGDNSKTTVIRVTSKNDSWEEVSTVGISKNGVADIYMYKKSSNKSGSFATGFRKDDLKNRDVFYADEQNKLSDLPGLKEPVNTSGDEISITELNNSALIISSNFSGMDGSYDFFIKKISIEAEKSLPEVFTVKIESENYKIPGEIKIKILFFTSLKKNSWPARTEIKSPDTSGMINIAPDNNIKRILLIPGEPGMKFSAVEFLTENRGIRTASIKVEASAEKEFTAQPVYFSFNSGEIRISDIPYLHLLIDYLRNNNSSLLSLEGYSDGVGSYKSNLDISLRRAERVKNYIVKAGIKKSRIKTTGAGYHKQKQSDTAQYNRRVESTIINQ